MLRAMSFRAIVVGSVCSAFVVAGCAYGEVRQVVRAQFASELDCPEVTLQKRNAWYGYDTPNQWKVSGCGVMRTYTCPDTGGLVSYDEPPCTWVEGDIDAPEVNLPKPGAMDEADEFGDEPLDEGGEGASEPEDPFEDEAGDAADDEPAPQGKAGGSTKAGASGSFRIGD